MNNKHTSEEKAFLQLYRDFLQEVGPVFKPESKRKIKNDIWKVAHEKQIPLSKISKALNVSLLANKELSLGYHTLASVLIYEAVYADHSLMDKISERYGPSVEVIVGGLLKAYDLYERHVSVETENFRRLLMTFAQDVRVIMIMIIERLYTMRHLGEYDEDAQQSIAREVAYLYAPMAHRMGLYAVKTELEDLSLKYTSREIYKEIANKLHQTKTARDLYIREFIEPVKKRLENVGLKFSIKGRTKSIYSIYQKIRRQQVPFEKVYDLFAIRVILDCPEATLEEEKSACWRAFSIVTDMYSYNTNRLRDWISAPKSNGYESLHVTVMGPQGKWVEVQIRTKRMDEIAEKGVAAHWKYKGIKSDSASADEWLKNLREILESSPNEDDAALMDEFKMQLYDDDVFVFTPKGDLHRLPKGSTVLDFAFAIHTNVGARCVGAVVNEKHVTFKYVLQNGDQVSVLTSPNQTPKSEWINYVHTSKARTKIRQSVREIENKEAGSGREILLRRLKNWKIDYNDGKISQLSKKMGFKTVTAFYVAIFKEEVNVLSLREKLTTDPDLDYQTLTAGNFVQETELQKITSQSDALIIDRNLKNVEYTLAKCCNPVFGDDIFGFVTINHGIKIHRKNCPNAPQMIERYGYRIVNARWAGETNSAGEYPIKLRIIGNDDIGIVSNITSVIAKESAINMRSISVDSHDGLFEGNITVMVKDVSQLKALILKIKNIKGVKQVIRS